MSERRQGARRLFFCRQKTVPTARALAVGIDDLCRRPYYADGSSRFAEAYVDNGYMPMAAVSIDYADGYRGFADGFSRRHRCRFLFGICHAWASVIFFF